MLLNIAVDFDFTWERPAKARGFAWQETRLVRMEGASFKSYSPLKVKDCSGLFRTFAGLAPDDAAMLGFADRYGALGGGWDDLAFWKEGIARVKGLVEVWDALSSEDWPALRTILSKLHKALFQPGKDCRRSGPAELVNAAVHLLYHEIGLRLFGRTFSAWDRQPSPVVWHSATKQPVLKITPPSLMDAMYLQFAWAILGNKRYQVCQACGRWFELLPRVNRADRKTCSNYCRLKLYRQRKRENKE